MGDNTLPYYFNTAGWTVGVVIHFFPFIVHPAGHIIF